MILRKPYAFLIKNFRIIHIILVFLSVYILNQTSNIYTFFSTYISNGYSAVITEDFSSSFINGTLYLVLLITIGILVAVAVLLTYKKKKEKMYYISIISYVLLFGFFIFYYVVFKNMESDLLSANTSIIYRDISLMFYLPQYLLVMFFAVRGLGFNVKQFNFSLDLKEMDLATEDNEEIELNIEFDVSKSKRNTRRFIREMKYYYKENTIFFIIISFVLVFTFSYNVITNLSFFTDYYYDMNESFYYNGVYVTIDQAEITDVDLGGDVINESSYFLVISVTIENTSSSDKTIDVNNFKIMYNGVLISPSNEYASKFSDYGSTLIYSTVKYSSSGTYVLVYEIDESDVSDDFTMKLFTSSYVDSGVTYPIYSIIDIDVTTLNYSVDPNSASLNTKLSFVNSNILSSSLVVSSYEVGDVFYYEYEKCISEQCSMYTSSLYVDYSSSKYKNKTILKIAGELILDSSSEYYSNNKSYYDFFDNFVKIEYVVGEFTYTQSISALTTTTNDGCYYLLIPSGAKNASNLTLVITIRNKEYRYVLN